MKTKLYAGLALVLCVMCLFTGAFAQQPGLELIRMHSSPDSTRLQLGVKLYGDEGTTVPADLNCLRVQAGDSGTALYPSAMSGQHAGHIIVVDTSLYYYGSNYVTGRNIQDIVKAYLSRVPYDQRVMFVLADASDASATGYMTASDATSFADTIKLGNNKSSCIYKAIRMAFDAAITPAADAPLFNSVFIVADPDQASNDNDGHSLGESEMLHQFSPIHPEVLLTVPYREKYVQNTGDRQREELLSSVEGFRSFCEKVGGTYVSTPQSSDGVDTAPLHNALNDWMGAAMYFELDYSQLSGYVTAGAGMQNLPLHLTYDDDRKYAQTTLTAEINTGLLSGEPLPVTQAPVTAPPVTAPPTTPPTTALTTPPPTTPPPTTPPPTTPPTTAPTPEPGVLDFVIQIGPLSVKLWMLGAAILALTVLSVVIAIVVAAGRRKKRLADIGEHSPSPSFQQLGMDNYKSLPVEEPIGMQNVEATIAKNYGTEAVSNVEATIAKTYGDGADVNVEATIAKNYGAEPAPDVEATLPRNYDQPEVDSEPTLQPYSTIQLSFEIIYNGQRRVEEAELMEDKPFLIGRKNAREVKQTCDLVLDNTDKFISRKQARLMASEGKLSLLDLSTYGNTLVNDQKIPHEKEGVPGVQLSSGDVIKMSSHTITIKWNA